MIDIEKLIREKKIKRLEETGDKIWEIIFNINDKIQNYEVRYKGKFLRYVDSFEEYELLVKQYQRMDKLKNILKD